MDDPLHHPDADRADLDPCTGQPQIDVERAAATVGVSGPVHGQQPDGLAFGASLVLPGDCQWSTGDFPAVASVQVGDWESMKAAATTGGQPVSVAGVGEEALNLNG